jgi:dTDP-4-amino-4,6-dideoxygalactose transaminase
MKACWKRLITRAPRHPAGALCRGRLRDGRDPGNCRRGGKSVVEDNAHGLFGKYKGRSLGTFGALATQSFHETKNITCGEGGALLINDPRYVERAEIMREKGTNRSRFFRGMVDKYTWVDIGSSYVLSDMLAAFLYAQLEVSQQIQEAAPRNLETYDQNLRGWAQQNGVQTPTVPEALRAALPYVLPAAAHPRGAPGIHRLSAPEGRLQRLPLPAAAPFRYGQKFGGKPGDCPVTESSATGWCACRFTTPLVPRGGSRPAVQMLGERSQ